jgi:hypothetical protein
MFELICGNLFCLLMLEITNTLQQFFSISKNSPSVIDFGGSLACSEVPATGPPSDPDKFNYVFTNSFCNN